MTDTTALSLDDRLRDAMAKHRAGDLTGAEDAYCDLVDTHPARADILYLLGTVACLAGRWADGARRFAESVAVRPDHALTHNNLGNALQNLGRAEDAADSYRRALEFDPSLLEARYNLGTVLQALGRADEAVEQYRTGLEQAPGEPLILNNLGSALLQLGRLTEAAATLRQALEGAPAYAEAHNNLGSALVADGDHAAAVTCFEEALRHRPDFPEALTNLGAALEKLERQDEAVDAYKRALELDPGNHGARARVRQALGRMVPAWHFPMMNDVLRNDAYEQAIKAAVRPDVHVLDIGTGAGLLALMSARAGARAVTTCEMVKPIAEKAREIVARNGYADRITVVAKKSNDAIVGQDLSERADLLVSEILSSDLLGECVIPSIEDARARLLKPGARMIPRAGSVRAFLAGGEDLEARIYVGRTSGFDVSAFNEFAPARFSIRRQNYPYNALSDDLTVFAFDFERQASFPAERKLIRIPVTRSGRCQGLVQWIHLQLDDETEFENHPNIANPASGWAHLFHSFPEPVELKEGQIVRLYAEHDRINVFMTLDGIE